MTPIRLRRFVGPVAFCLASTLAAQAPAVAPAPPPCDCAAIFARTVARLETDYVAFPLEVRAARAAEWRAHVEALRPAASDPAITSDATACTWLLRRLTGFFRDGHLFILDLPTADSSGLAARRDARPVRDVSPGGAWQETRVRAALDSARAAHRTLATVEGIWRGPGYRIAVRRLPDDTSRAIGVLVAVDSGPWSAGQVRAEFSLVDGRWRATVWDDAFQPRSAPVTSSRGAMLRMAPLLWGRVDDGERFAFVDPADPRAPRVAVLDDSTAVLSVVTFDPAYGPALERVVEEAWDVLRASPRLVIDLRGNEGGSSGQAAPLLPFVWRDDALSASAQESVTRSSPAMIAYWERSGWAPRGLLDRLRAAPGALVPFDPGARQALPRAPRRQPRADQEVILLVDAATVSAAEQVVLWTRRFGRARIVGAPTGGSIDYQSAWIGRVACPAMGHALGMPVLATSARLPDGGHNATGILPDLPLATTGDWPRALRRALGDPE